MFEVKVSITAPELTEALNGLAAAIGGKAPVAIPISKDRAESEKVIPDSTPVTNPTAPEVQAAPVQPVPSAPAPSDAIEKPLPTIDTLSRAGAALCEQGKMPQLIELLSKYGVQAVTQLNTATPETLVLFAHDLRALGANI